MSKPEYSEPNAKNELEIIPKYEAKGYNLSFRVEDEKLIASEIDKKYSPDEVSIVAEHRFEGMSNPSDNSILYVLKTNDDKKGTIVNGYGPAANLEVFEFLKSIPEENISHDDSILNL